MNTATLPRDVAPLAGRIVDVDSHEMMPAQIWVETFGEIARPIADLIMSLPSHNKTSPNIPGYAGDRAAPAQETLWSTKGADSPGSFDMARRLEVLDMMTVNEQLLHPLPSSALSGHSKAGPIQQRFAASRVQLSSPMEAQNARKLAHGKDWAVARWRFTRAAVAKHENLGAKTLDPGETSDRAITN